MRNFKIKSIERTLVVFVLIIALSASSFTGYGAISEDRGIVSADIANEYIGHTLAGDITTNVDFTDVDDDYWAREAIVRMGAIDVTKGYVIDGVRQFRPTSDMSVEETITFLMRAIGMEEEAKVAAEALDAADGDTTASIWSKGYLSIANQIGIIDNGELIDALNVDQTVLDPAFNFIRSAGVTREQVAKWIVQTLNFSNPDLIAPIYRQQNVFTFEDFDEMGLDYIPYIEAVVEEEIMIGDGTNFNPQGSLTRAEMMQILKNIDKILYDAMGLTEKSGYVGHIDLTHEMDGLGDVTTYSALVRTSEGSVDKLSKVTDEKISGVEDISDAVVYKGDTIGSISDLREGDTIHYIVDEATSQVYYVQVIPSTSIYHVEGVLEPLNEYAQGKITIENIYGYNQTYQMADTLYNVANNTIVIDEKYISIDNAPITNKVKLTIKNQLVTAIEFGGTLVTLDEFNGIVIEHNTDFNYIRVSDWDGNEVVKRYVEGDVDVEKENYYDSEDQVGYIDQLYPYYGYDEDDAPIEAIEAGDIVHIKLDSPGGENIIAISAKTNYTVKFGEVLSSRNRGDDGYDLTIEMFDNSVVSYQGVDNIPVIEGSKNLTVEDVESGDLVRLLVNQAVIAPGTIKESIKEINIDPNGNVIETIYKGELGTINKSQETIAILNSFELLQSGWQNYETALTLDISKEDIEYFYDDERVSIDFIDKYLRVDGMDVYIAMEKYFDDERVSKVTFREERDSVLDYSNVTITNGYNQLETGNSNGSVNIDEGTIVVKNGKMISASNIMAPDYTQIVLNGNAQAAVLMVKPEPNNDSISVMRGRVASINEYEDFTVQSHASLEDMEWIYSPIERTYEINYETVIKDEDTTIGIDEFIGYSDSSKVDNVYTIIADGVNATHIVEGPYVLEGVIGEIYEISTTDNTISMKDTLVYNTDTKEWDELSRPNSYSQATLSNLSIIIKNNEVISIDELTDGDRLRIMSDVDLADELTDNDTREFDGYIVFVE